MMYTPFILDNLTRYYEENKHIWRNHYLKNKNKIEKYQKEYKDKNKAKTKKYNKSWWMRNKERERLKQKIKTKELRLVVYNHYCNNNIRCMCCNENNIEFLSIDHINNDGNKFRKTVTGSGRSLYLWIIRNKFPKDLQVLCMNCNFGRHRNSGICPHKTATKN